MKKAYKSLYCRASHNVYVLLTAVCEMGHKMLLDFALVMLHSQYIETGEGKIPHLLS
jgi:hypothetical protein